MYSYAYVSYDVLIYNEGETLWLRRGTLGEMLRNTVYCRLLVNCKYMCLYEKKIAEEFLRELMPIFESLRQRESLPCSYPLAMGPSRQTNTFWVNCQNKKKDWKNCIWTVFLFIYFIILILYIFNVFGGGGGDILYVYTI